MLPDILTEVPYISVLKGYRLNPHFRLLLLLFSTASILNAQQPHPTADSLATWNLLQESMQVIYADPDSAEMMIETAMNSSLELNNTHLIANCHNYFGVLFDVKGMRREALHEYGIASRIADSVGNDRIYASAVNNIGLIEWQQGDYVNAVRHFQESLLIFEEIGIQVGVANTLNNIGLIYLEQSRREQSLEYFYRARSAYEGLKQPYGQSAALVNISRAYEELNILDSASRYISLALDIKKEINDPRGVAMCYANTGVIASKLGLNDSSIHCFEKALEIDRANGFQSYMAQHLSAIGKQYFDINNPEKAEAAYLEALALAEQGHELKTIWGLHSRLSDLYAAQGEYRRAHDHAQKYADTYVEWRNEEQENEVLKLEERFDVARKEAEWAKRSEEAALDKVALKEQENWIIILGSGTMFLLIAGGFGYSALRRRQLRLRQEHRLKEKLSETRHELELNHQREGISKDLHDTIGSQLTFLSSTLKNLTWALRHQKSTGESAIKRLEEVSGYAQNTVRDLREAVWAMNRSEMSIGEIMLRLESSVRQYREAFEGIDVRFISEGDNTVDLPADEAMALYRILQEALTNARKHASPTSVSVKAVIDDAGYEVCLKDNGNGFDMDSASAGNGMRNMKHRAAESGLDLNVVSSGEGTEINIRKRFKEE